jgi:hypothetical protein
MAGAELAAEAVTIGVTAGHDIGEVSAIKCAGNRFQPHRSTHNKVHPAKPDASCLNVDHLS